MPRRYVGAELEGGGMGEEGREAEGELLLFTGVYQSESSNIPY
ncbi:MAG TPA: hypothetical protein VLL52_08215 [Anaerolineae bacterium]|nr:hypothetical protein [Anaerolineae bacterium]